MGRQVGGRQLFLYLRDMRYSFSYNCMLYLAHASYINPVHIPSVCPTSPPQCPARPSYIAHTSPTTVYIYSTYPPKITPDVLTRRKNALDIHTRRRKSTSSGGTSSFDDSIDSSKLPASAPAPDRAHHSKSSSIAKAPCPDNGPDCPGCFGCDPLHLPPGRVQECGMGGDPFVLWRLRPSASAVERLPGVLKGFNVKVGIILFHFYFYLLLLFLIINFSKFLVVLVFPLPVPSHFFSFFSSIYTSFVILGNRAATEQSKSRLQRVVL